MSMKFPRGNFPFFFQETLVLTVATGIFVEEVEKLFDNFYSNFHAPPFKKLLRSLSCDIPHIGYWTRQALG